MSLGYSLKNGTDKMNLRTPVKGAMLLLAGLTFICSADDVQSKTIAVRMGIHNFPPDFSVSADGNQCGGTAVEVLDQILLPQGYKIVPVCTTPARMYRLLDSGDIDLSISTITNKLISKTHSFLLPPYLELELVLYSHFPATDAPQDNTVAAIRGFDYQDMRGQMLKNGYKFIDMPDAISAVNFFIHQRSQYLLTYQGPFLYFMQHNHPDTINNFDYKSLKKLDIQVVVSAYSIHRLQLIKMIKDYAELHKCSYLTDCLDLY